jgi:1,4-dihydroxy-2-naphthoyl-CoA hydrolase
MDHAEIIESAAKSKLFQMLDIVIEEAEPGRVVLSMPVDERVHQYIGIMNGGISLLLAESAASIGAVISSDLSKVAPVGIEINANHLRPVSRGRVTAEANSVYHGKTLSVWQIEIKDRRGRLVCVSRCTLALRKGAAQISEKEFE